MAHGFNSFMGNKDFHPGSFRNLKKVWEAEQELKLEEKRQEELRLQYLKEQEQYQSKELLGKANPMGFMYEPPPSFAKDKEEKNDEENGEQKLKFDWQKEDKAPPREKYAKDMAVRDQPFGIEVRNVRCIKCGKMGHINTDRECPLFGQLKEGAKEPFEYPIITNWDALDDGLKFKQCVKDRVVDGGDPLQQYVVSDNETEMVDILAQFSPKQRKRILKKLAKSESKKEMKKKKHKRDDKSESSSKRKTKSGKHHKETHHHKRKYRHHSDSGSSSSGSESTSSDEWVESDKVKRTKHCGRTDRKESKPKRRK